MLLQLHFGDAQPSNECIGMTRRRGAHRARLSADVAGAALGLAGAWGSRPMADGEDGNAFCCVDRVGSLELLIPMSARARFVFHPRWSASQRSCWPRPLLPVSGCVPRSRLRFQPADPYSAYCCSYL